MKQALKHLPHIGMRKMKSVLAVFIGFWIWQLFRVFVPELELHPIYIYIYGIIEIRDSSTKTVDFSKLRIKATFTALGIGLPLLFLSVYLQSLVTPAWAETAVELAVVLFGTLLVLCVAEVVGCRSFCGLAAAMFIILLVSHSDGEPWSYAVLRSVQTLIGVFIAWLLNVKLFPYSGTDDTRPEPPSTTVQP